MSDTFEVDKFLAASRAKKKGSRNSGSRGTKRKLRLEGELSPETDVA